MTKDAPFDVWDGEDLGTDELTEAVAAEDVAMHVELNSVEIDSLLSSASLDAETADDAPAIYFDDEQPELAKRDAQPPADEHELDLEELLERQHYAFKP